MIIKESTIRLYEYFSIIFGNKFTSGMTEEKIKLWLRIWNESLYDIDVNIIKKVIKQIQNEFEWPPSLAEFRKLCEKGIGIPLEHEVLKLCVARDFSHPVVENIYNKIGSWALSHDSEKDLIKKISKIYRDEVKNYRICSINDQKKISNKQNNVLELRS